MVIRILGVFGLLVMFGCGSDSNFNGFFVPDLEGETYEAVLERAQLEYDQSNYSASFEFAKKAETMNPSDSRSSIIAGFAALGNASIDPVGLGKKLIENDILREKNNEETQTGDFLGDLSSVLDIGPNELAQLGTKKNADELFTYDYYIPKAPTDIRRDFSRLRIIKEVVTSLCPFIPTTSKLATDVRHDCDIKNTNNENQTVLQFLWAISHLGEAVYFNSVLLFVPEGQTKPALQLIADSFEKKTITAENLADSLEIVGRISDVASSIFSADNGDASMISVLLDDLDIAKKALADIDNIPESFRQGVDDATKNIEALREKLNNTSDSTAIQAELTKGIAGTILKKLSDPAVRQELENQELTDEACASVKKLLGIGADTAIPDSISQENLCD